MNKFILLLLTLFSISGFTQSQAEFLKACSSDIKKCSDVTPGEGRILKCLKAQKSLKDECKKVIGKTEEQMGDHLRKMMADCKDAAQKLCKDIQPGEGRVLECLKKHESSPEMNDSCKAHLKKK